MNECGATASCCRCNLPAGHEPPHICEEPDPTCGGQWTDHPHDPDRMLIVRYPGIRGNPDTMQALADDNLVIYDPPPDQPADEPRPEEMIYIPGLGCFPRRAPRGGIKFYPPPELEE